MVNVRSVLDLLVGQTLKHRRRFGQPSENEILYTAQLSYAGMF